MACSRLVQALIKLGPVYSGYVFLSSAYPLGSSMFNPLPDEGENSQHCSICDPL